MENSGDRDHPEEMNWYQEGGHYGFPWTKGGVVNPQSLDNYNPGVPNQVGNWCNAGPSTDAWIQSQPVGNCGTKSFAWVHGYFYNDPTFPSAPEDVTFNEPIKNFGPQADKYRDEADNQIKDASDASKSVATFSPHLSPAG
ncbi:MAG: hypothetical protein HC842_05530 [Cytophagales bacterium]|nr:hypothetical protein [Cytophagales bacterium]